ncbi:MAG: hypothetical protein SNJ52_01060 [Verrucomicrobiia bacterium]
MSFSVSPHSGLLPAEPTITHPADSRLAVKRTVHAPELIVLLWLYVVLLIIEGALRKWFLPGLATPLLLVRDPVVLAMYASAFARGIFPTHPLVLISMVLGVVTFCFSLFAEQFVPVVAIYGWRSNFLFIPFIFLLPRFVTRKDLVNIGKFWLIVTIPMCFLLVAQFRQPPDAFINVGVGGTEGFTTSLNKVRTSGTFSFVNGTVAFLGVACAFLCYGLFQRRIFSPWLITAAGVACIMSIAVSGSRSAVFVLSQVIFGVLIAGLYRREVLGDAFRMVVLLAMMAAVISQIDIFEEGLEVHAVRFETAAHQENVFARIVEQFSIDTYLLQITPLFGFGLGMGTNVGAAYTTGEIGFLLAENDWSRVLLESGPVLGLAFIGVRVLLFWHVFWTAFRSMKRGDALPFILFSASSLTILAGQLGQATGLGFIVFTAGLVLAAANAPPEESAEGIQPAVDSKVVGASSQSFAPGIRRFRGRSPFSVR